jgi:hypothetical protein
MTVENTSTATGAGLLFSYYIVLSFWAAQSLGMSMLSRNVSLAVFEELAVNTCSKASLLDQQSALTNPLGVGCWSNKEVGGSDHEFRGLGNGQCYR